MQNYLVKGKRRYCSKLLKEILSTRYLIILATFVFAASANSQSGGANTFEFLNLTHSARSTALSGGLVSVIDHDVALAYANPALLNNQMHNEISFNQNFHFAGISHGFFSYGHHIGKYNTTAHLGVNYINYGTFDRADEFGNRQETFDASSTAITFGGGKMINERMSIGVNLKVISSRLESYTSMGLGADIGATYYNPENLLTYGFVIKNIGAPISNYADNRESFPLDIQLGLSKRFEHLPFRLSIVAHRLNDWNLRYDDPSQINRNIFGEPINQSSPLSQFTDNFFKHFIFNGEFLLGKGENFRLRLGYNHLRRKELSVSTFRSLGGFSMGVGFKVKRFRFDYGVGYYHLAGGVNHISISTNLNEWRKKV